MPYIRRFTGFRFFFAIAVTFLALSYSAGVQASTLVPQTWLPGDSIFSTIAFTQPLPVFGPGYNATLPRVNALRHPFLKVTMKEVDQQVLPGYGPTKVWAYETADAITGKILGPAHWPAVTVEAQRFIPTTIKYVNQLPSFGAGGLLQGLVSVDQTLHWANPLGDTGSMMCGGVDCTLPTNSGNACCQVYTGPVPAVPHLHGAEVPSAFDGGPNAWFTPNGLKGPDYQTVGHPANGEAIYVYPNLQEPGTLWFHDHALGATRTNVFSGLAAFYFLRGPLTEPRNLPTGAYEVELAVQDRQFDTTGQLYFPDGSGNPDSNINGTPPNPDVHPYWNPEFFGDVAVVNGAPWPVFHVEPRRYLLRILDGSNARMYRLSFGNAPAYQVGADDNYLDSPKRVYDPFQPLTPLPFDAVAPNPGVFIGPGERAHVIVDFTGLEGQTITVRNDAAAPFPSGLVPGVDSGQLNIDKIMQFVVSVPLKSKDKSCNPANGACGRPIPQVRLADGNGNVASSTKIAKVRQLVLKEVQGPGGPIEVLVNNTKWHGLMSPSIQPLFPKDGVSELPRVGSTELWEIINLTMDAHPMHTHLTQFQVLNREAFDSMGYGMAWESAFPAATGFNPACTGGVVCPAYGPPLPYTILNADGAIGGNPAVSPYLSGVKVPPNPEESGWKDTAKVLPGQVMRMLVRWTPSEIPNFLAKPGRNLYAFDPTKGPGYVWHCHIIDHEDNEMMRPYKVTW
jgi:FtsP/CotA-like multicopper oxidase with cupredoxin domain